MADPAAEQLLPYALCSPEDVSVYLWEQSAPAANQRNVLARLINLFTKTSEGPLWCNREWERRERTEYFDLTDGIDFEALYDPTEWVQLAAPPVALAAPVDAAHAPQPVIQLWNSGSTPAIYTDATKLVYGQDYTVDASSGIVRGRAQCFLGGLQALKVIYTGGVVVPADPNQTETFPTVPDDLRFACAMQVAAWWQRKKELNLDSVSFPGGGAITLMDPTRMVAAVADVLQKYRLYQRCA